MMTREAPFGIRLGDLRPKLEKKLKLLNQDRKEELTLHAQIKEILEKWI